MGTKRVLLTQEEVNLLQKFTEWLQTLSVDDMTAPSDQVVKAYQRGLFYGMYRTITKKMPERLDQ